MIRMSLDGRCLSGLHRIDFNPFESSLAQVAEFLLFFTEERKVSWGTIAGYRSALGHVLRLVSGYDPGSCEILTQLMKSFKRTQPISARRVPEWDVSLVQYCQCY